MNGTSKYTVWHYVGCGCVILLVLGALVLGGLVWFGFRTGQDMAEQLRDPEARARKIQELLGYEELPAGYHPGFALSVPFVMDMVVVGDHELPEGEAMEGFDEDDVFDERGFLYFRFRSFGTGADQEMSGEMDYDFEPDEVVAEGRIEAGGARVDYRAQLGTSHTGSSVFESVAAELEIDCDDAYRRQAIWFTPAPEAAEGGEAGASPAPDRFTGTPADEDALREFLDHFRFCG